MTAFQNDVIAWFELLRDSGFQVEQSESNVIGKAVRYSLGTFKLDELMNLERGFYSLPWQEKTRLIQMVQKS